MILYNFFGGSEANKIYGIFTNICDPLVNMILGIKSKKSLRLWPSLLVLLLISIFIILADSHAGGSFTQDIDDELRHVQIQDLLRDGDWFDPVLPLIEQPSPYVSPWSRLVDAPYVFIAWTAMLFTDEASALKFAESIVPSLLLIFACFFYARIFNSLTQTRNDKKTLPLLPIAIGGGLFFASILEFVPGRIDHHNFQFLCLLIFIDGVIGGTRRKGWQAGAAVVTSVAIGLEVLPLLAIGIMAQGIFALKGDARAIKLLTGIGEAICALTLPMALMLIGPSGIGKTYCDSFSAPWVAGLMAVGVFMALLPRQWNNAPTTQDIIKRVSIAVFFGSIILIALGWLFPSCLSGPFVEMNPIAREEWLQAIGQEKSILAGARAGEADLHIMMLSLMAVMVAMTVSWFWPKAGPEQKTIYIIMIAAIIFACLQIRGIRLAWAIYALGVPALIAAYLTSGTAVKAHFARWKILGLIAIFPIGGFALSHLPQSKAPVSLSQILQSDDCPDAAFAALDNLPPGHVLAPLGLSMPLATHISDKNLEHTIRAVPFHRSDEGIASIFKLLDGRQRINAESVEYIAVCRLPENLIEPQTGVFGDALRGIAPMGYNEVLAAREGRFRLFQKM